MVGTIELRLHARSGAVARRLGRELSARARQPALEVAPALKVFVNRSREIQELTGALMQGRALFELWGPDGAGKTAPIRELLSDPMIASFGGVLRLRDSSGLNDMLQAAFDAAYDAERPFAPVGVQRNHLLAVPRFLVIVDDFEGDDEDAEALYSSLPLSSFIFVTGSGRLSEPVQSLEIGLLSQPDGRSLYESVVSGDLRMASPAGETPDLTHCTPLDIVRIASARRISGETPENARAAPTTLIGSLSATDNLVLAPFLVAGEPLDSVTAGELAGLPGPAPILDSLCSRGLVDFDGQRYRVRQEVLDGLPITVTPQRVSNALSAILRTARSAAQCLRAGRLRPCREPGFGSRGQLRFERAGDPDGRILSSALLTAGRLDRCRDTLQIVLEAARKERDRDTEAWALHQLGTVAFVAGDDSAAQTGLSRALELRDRLLDEAGVSATRNNLSLLLGITSGAANGKPAERPSEFRLVPVLWGVGAGIAALILAALWIFKPFAPSGPLARHRAGPAAHAHYASAGHAVNTRALPAESVALAAPALLPAASAAKAEVPKAEPSPVASGAGAHKAKAPEQKAKPKQIAAAGATAKTPGGQVGVEAFGANPATVAEGEYAQLCYTVHNASSAFIDGVGAVAAKGSHCVTVRATQTHTFALVATGGGQSTKAFTTLSVTATASKPEPSEL